MNTEYFYCWNIELTLSLLNNWVIHKQIKNIYFQITHVICARVCKISLLVLTIELWKTFVVICDSREAFLCIADFDCGIIKACFIPFEIRQLNIPRPQCQCSQCGTSIWPVPNRTEQTSWIALLVTVQMH